MKFVILFVLLHANIFAVDFQQLFSNHKNQKYGSVFYNSALLLEDSFKNILQKSYDALPYTRTIIRSNQSYSFDLQNNQMQFSTLIEYTFNYNNSRQLKLSLIYAFEQVSYYNAYIMNSQYSRIREDIPVHKTASGDMFLWDIDSSTAFYVYKFPQSKIENPVANNIIPGLLLKVEFKKGTPYSNEINDVLNQIIKNTK